MKKIRLFMAVGILMGILASTANAQVDVSVKGTPVVQLMVNGNKVVIKNGETKRIAATCEQDLIMRVAYLEGGQAKNTTVTKPAGACQMTLELTGNGLQNTFQAGTKMPAASERAVSPPSQITTVMNRTVTLRLYNPTRYTCSALDGEFKGVALAPLDTSKIEVVANTGVISFAIIFSDTADYKQLRQAVITRILTQDDKLLTLQENDFAIPTKDKVKLYAYNDSKFKFVFANSIFSGVSLSPGGHCKKKLQIQYGFLSMIVEYFGTDGLKYRANVEKIITPQDKVIHITDKDLQNSYQVK